ncbi:MAG: indole-3-glycerol phosphate synthase TrpC, partial [Planctomycetota bacterium]|nr:indole-3-glycerol phosphate synthase TrpC [Planctomycetota bacterium]
MPDILDKILAVKRREVADLAQRRADLRSAARDAPPPRGFARALRRRKGLPEKGAVPFSRSCEKGTVPFSGADPIRIIAEVKHRSPSASIIIEPFEPAEIARRYADAGADAISCLTDREFFGGSIEHLRQVRAAVGLPVLRKDFLIAADQVYEARAAGADAILLIAEALEQAEMTDLAGLAGSFGMDVLAETHSEQAIEKAIACGAACVGINN